jgi:hypothetical protein
MSYIDEAFYNNTFHGEPVDSADFPSLSMRAGEIVEEMTMFRLTPTSFLVMSEDLQNRVKCAVCAQLEYLEANGGSDMDNGSDLQSAGLGKFNYSKSAGAGGSTKQSLYAPRTSRYLLPTGLLYRGGGCK